MKRQSDEDTLPPRAAKKKVTSSILKADRAQQKTQGGTGTTRRYLQQLRHRSDPDDLDWKDEDDADTGNK